MCPICYEEMEGQCYSGCTTCKKSLHTRCFKVWTKHKEDSSLPVTCPMCRTPFVNPMALIYNDLAKWETRFSTHKGTLCRGCGMKNIKGLIFKCLMCQNTDLCKMCYEGNQHPDHQKYFMKELSTSEWKTAPLRLKKAKKQLFQPMKEMQPTNIQPIQSQAFILDLFPTLKQFNLGAGGNQLGIIGNDILTKQLCFKCRKSGSELMRRLNCGHNIHQQCLLSMIQSQQYLCQVDNQAICPGYLSAMGIKVAKPKKKAVDCAFIKNQQEISRIKGNIHGYNLNDMEINGFIAKTSSNIKRQTKSEKRNQSVGINPKSQLNISKSKDKNFRIIKKNAIDRRNEETNLGFNPMSSPIMITGFGHQSTNSSINQQIATGFSTNLPPRMKPASTASHRLGQR